MFRPFVLAATAVMLLAASAVGQNAPAAAGGQPTPGKSEQVEMPKLMVGDTAPALTIEKWVKGAPVSGLERGKVYVVEFWATWCGPCIAAMPHLTELQKEYQDEGVTIIGVTSESPRNRLPAVEKMVEQKGDVIGYRIAWDAGRKMDQAWKTAAGWDTIPCSFLVDRQGRIAFIGHPVDLDEPLKQVVAGTFDIDKARAESIAQRELEAKLKPLQQRLRAAMQQGDAQQALAVLDEMEKLAPQQAENLATQRFGLHMHLGQTQQAYVAARKLVDGPGRNNAMLLNYIAWTIVDPDGKVEDKDLDLALRAAERAVELTEGKDAATLDTLAVAHFLRGDVDRAIEVQTRAVDLAKSNPEMLAELESRLEEFKAARKRGN